MRRTLALAALAAALAFVALGAPPADAHTFPPVRTVVVQVERCELALLVGYRAGSGSGDNTDRLLARVASLPREKAAEAIRDLLAAQAMAPLAVTVDGKPLAPTSVHAKLPAEQGGSGTRPMVVVLVTYLLPAGKTLAITSQDPRTTRFSWTDRESLRVPLADAPAQGRWFSGAAVFSLRLAPPPAGACAAPASSAPASSAPAAPAPR